MFLVYCSLRPKNFSVNIFFPLRLIYIDNHPWTLIFKSRLWLEGGRGNPVLGFTEAFAMKITVIAIASMVSTFQYEYRGYIHYICTSLLGTVTR